MNSTKSEIAYTGYQGNTRSFIKEIIGEMKFQFNKSELNVCEVIKETLVTDIQEDKLSQKERTTVNEMLNSEIANDHIQTDINDQVASKMESELFKKPDNESQDVKGKVLSPGKRSPRLKVEKNVIKRYSRRRSKDSSESILQSAIARKEKSYNEPSRPQRLSRQLKTAGKLANLGINKLEKNVEDSYNGDAKRQKKVIKKRKITKVKANYSDEIDSNTPESLSDTELSRSTKQHSPKPSATNCSEESVPAQIIIETEKTDIGTKQTDSSNVESQQAALRLCLCEHKTNLFADVKDNDIMFCTAIDSIEEKLVGCSRVADVRTIPLLRPAQRVPYQILCELHKNRLTSHNCCPVCGIFCSQGWFATCENNHQYHRKCQFAISPQQCCPHCAMPASTEDVFIKLHFDKKPVFLPTQKLNYPTAKMSYPSIEHGDPSSRPLLSPENIKNLCQYAVAVGGRFTESDVIEAVREDNESKLAAIIASNSVDLRFKIVDFNDGTLLHYAAFNGFITICHLLILANFDIDEFDKEQNTALMLAISEHKNHIVNYLIKAGASISMKGTDGMTALHTAAKCGNLDGIKFILRSSSIPNFINCQDDGGWTPLVWACEHGHIEVVSYLISNGANPHLRDVEYNEALHWAAFSGSSDVLELLLNAGCDVNTFNVQGETPLHIAAREERANCIIMLLSRGADVSVANKNRKSPVDYAAVGSDSYNILLLHLKFHSAIGSKTVKLKTILSNDISRGRESNPIQCVNIIDEEPEPTGFVYITKNCTSQKDLNVDNNILSIHSCSCTDNCATDKCSCGIKSSKCWYDEDGKLGKDFNFEDAPVIFECNDTCSCNAITCRNRVVQKGLTQRFQIFKTEQKGWGLKTLRLISKGSFVCEYIGEILTDAEADSREDDSFLFSLSNNDSESFCVDAKSFGNISRFINHSCSPNLYPIKLFVDHQDLRFPRIALFAQREIPAEEELSFDYGERFWQVKYKSSPCQCGLPDCKYSNTDKN